MSVKSHGDYAVHQNHGNAPLVPAQPTHFLDGNVVV